MVNSKCSPESGCATNDEHRDGDDVERRIMKARRLVELGELSFARQTLEGAVVVAGDEATLDKLHDERCGPHQPREQNKPHMIDVRTGNRVSVRCPLGHPAHVQSFLRAKTEDHALLQRRIPEVPDLQSACASTTANCLLRALPPCVTQEFTANHDESSRACLTNLLDRVLPDDRWELASMPLSLRGLGLRNASRTKPAAHWATGWIAWRW